MTNIALRLRISLSASHSPDEQPCTSNYPINSVDHQITVNLALCLQLPTKKNYANNSVANTNFWKGEKKQRSLTVGVVTNFGEVSMEQQSPLWHHNSQQIYTTAFSAQKNGTSQKNVFSHFWMRVTVRLEIQAHFIFILRIHWYNKSCTEELQTNQTASALNLNKARRRIQRFPAIPTMAKNMPAS